MTVGKVDGLHEVQSTGEVVDQLLVSHNLDGLTLEPLLENHGVSGDNVERIIAVDGKNHILVVSSRVFRTCVDDVH